MVELAEFNSRMKDFHDLYWFQEHQNFELPLLVDAIRNTFHQRETPFPNALPSILVPTTQSESAHQKQWNAYLREKRLTDIPKSFQEICRQITKFLEIPLRFAATDKPEIHLQWIPNEGWIHFDIIPCGK
ncbi:MAG: nucleotidyl transferase AbiEii/AbiGii toxin family protein [Verrucomicrobia bacterium]|nr:nucleotidyl transferase AbiEii/AbiGii toxin family protein [Verrucomicrobiota bacterium]MCH8511319.1 nucleotidyl transferase AbiEii/AbiGii toxin family protein [Kiritimatiellia bacterium]